MAILLVCLTVAVLVLVVVCKLKMDALAQARARTTELATELYAVTQQLYSRADRAATLEIQFQGLLAFLQQWQAHLAGDTDVDADVIQRVRGLIVWVAMNEGTLACLREEKRYHLRGQDLELLGSHVQGMRWFAGYQHSNRPQLGSFSRRESNVHVRTRADMELCPMGDLYGIIAQVRDHQQAMLERAAREGDRLRAEINGI